MLADVNLITPVTTPRNPGSSRIKKRERQENQKVNPKQGQPDAHNQQKQEGGRSRSDDAPEPKRLEVYA